MFSRKGWDVVRSASLAKGGTSQKRLSPHLHKVLTRSNEVESMNFANGSCMFKIQTTTVIKWKNDS
jgi:hypothetical protein